MTVAVREATTDELGAAGLAQVLDLCRACWPDGSFSADDLAHASGGRHFLAEVGGRIVAHAAVVERRLEVDGRPLRAGYVEAVATLPAWRRQGIATRLMTAANRWIAARYEVGALSAAAPRLYERAGWEPWAGPLGVRTRDGVVASDPEAEQVMVLRTPATPPLTLREALTCEERAGDAW